MNIYILLDRSGSMSSLWNEAINSINAYVEKLGKKGNVHLAVFDSVSHDVVRDCKLKDWTSVSETEVTPRGGTPLYDSCARIMSKAEGANGKKTMLVVMTDGYENASKEVTQQQIKDRVKTWEDKKWEVVFLGANFNSVESVSGSVGVMSSKTMNYGTGQFMRGMDALATSTTLYATQDVAVNFDESLKQSLSSSSNTPTP